MMPHSSPVGISGKTFERKVSCISSFPLDWASRDGQYGDVVLRFHDICELHTGLSYVMCCVQVSRLAEYNLENAIQDSENSWLYANNIESAR